MNLESTINSGSQDGVDPFDVGVDDDFIYYLRAGGEALRAGNPAEARQALERAYALRPDNSRAQNLLGLAYFKLGLLEAAKAIYDRLVREFPGEAPLRVNLGLVLLRQGRLNEAEEAFRSALKQSPGHARAHCYLGLVLYRRGELEEAKDHFVRGDAKEFATRIDRKLQGDSTGRPEPSDLLKEVADTGVERISNAPGPLFTRVEGVADEPPIRNEEAWETQVTHGSQENTTGDFDTPSLLSVIAPAPTGDLEGADNDLGSLPIDMASGNMTAPPVPDDVAFGTLRSHSSDLGGLAVDVPLVEPSLRLYQDLDWTLGFSAGSELSSSACLMIDEGDAWLRGSAVVAYLGDPIVERVLLSEDVAFGGSDAFCRFSGRAKILTRVPRFAIAFREVTDIVVRESALIGFEGVDDWSPGKVFDTGVVRLKGRGSLLLDAESAPVVAPLQADRPLVVSADAVLAWTDALDASTVTLGQDGTRLISLQGAGFAILAGPSA